MSLWFFFPSYLFVLCVCMSSHHATFKWEKHRWHFKETAIDIYHQPVHETPVENNEPFTGAFECMVLNSETVCEKNAMKSVLF